MFRIWHVAASLPTVALLLRAGVGGVKPVGPLESVRCIALLILNSTLRVLFDMALLLRACRSSNS